MTSKAQKRSGWAFPIPLEREDTYCVQFRIPADPLYRQATRDAIRQLTYWNAWKKTYRPGDINAKLVAEMFRALIAETLTISENCGDENMCIQAFRPKPGDPCTLQYQDANGDWFDGFDFEACLRNAYVPSPPEAAIPIMQQGSAYNAALRYDYQDNAANIAPSLVRDGGPYDGTREQISCYIATLLIDTLIDAALKAEEAGIGAEDFNQILTISAGSVGGLLLGLAGLSLIPPVAGAYGAGLAFAAALSGLLSLFDDDDGPVLRDEAARDELRCCFSEALEGSLPTFEAFRDGLDACAFDAGSTAERLRQLMVPMVESLDVYLNFLDLMESVWSAALDAGVDQFPCPCGEWCYTFDLTASQHDFIIEQVGTPPNLIPAAVYVPGSGLRFNGSTFTSGSLYVSRALPPGTYTSVKMQFVNGGTISFGVLPWNVQFAEGATPRYSKKLTATIFPPAGSIKAEGFLVDDADILRLWRISSTNKLSTFLTAVTLSGRGTNPFGTDNC